MLVREWLVSWLYQACYMKDLKSLLIILLRDIYCFSKQSGFRMLRGCFYCEIREAGISVGSPLPRIFKRD